MDRHFDNRGSTRLHPEDAAERTLPAQLLDLVRADREQHSIAVLADNIGPHKIRWVTDFPHQDGFSLERRR